jgi:hypothetical protein
MVIVPFQVSMVDYETTATSKLQMVNLVELQI